MFVVLLEYIKTMEEIDALLPAHRAYLDRHYAAGHFIASGAQNPRTGGVILARPIGRAQLESILAEDPFQQNAVATYRIVEFTPSKFAPGAELFFSAN